MRYFQSAREKRVMVLILALLTVTAFFLRIKYMEKTVINNPLIADAGQYVQYGYNLAFKHTFSKDTSRKVTPDSFRSPGFPMLIALSFTIGGVKYFYPLTLLFQTLMSTMVVPVTFLLGLHLFSPGYAIAASFLTAISPHLISSSSYVLTETQFCFLLFLALLCYVQEPESKGSKWPVISGSIMGLAYFTNQTALFIPFIWATAHLAGSGKNKTALKKTAVFLAVFLIFPAAWAIRNKIVIPHGAPTGKHRLLGSMSHGTYPGFIHKTYKYRYFPYREDKRQGEIAGSFKGFATVLLERANRAPMKYLSWYLLEKPRILWSWNILQGQGDVFIYPVSTSLYHTSRTANLTRETMKLLHPLLVFLSAGGVAAFIYRWIRGIRPEPGPEAFLFPLVIYYTILHSMIVPWPRYSIPLRPALYLLGIHVLSKTISLAGRWKKTR